MQTAQPQKKEKGEKAAADTAAGTSSCPGRAEAVSTQPGVPLFLQSGVRLVQAKNADASSGSERRDDPCERQADAAADAIVKMAAPDVKPEPASGIQRKPAAGDSAKTPKSSPGRMDALKDGGRPLPASSLAYFQPRFNYNFNDVRVHADAGAGELAESLQARAFTHGNDVVFAPGQFSLKRLRENGSWRTS